MLTVAALAGEGLGRALREDFLSIFGHKEEELGHALGTVARLVLEMIGRSNALYHNLEHTMLVTLAGRDILRGRILLEPVSANDWAHFLLACVTHDVGFVRGALAGDSATEFVINASGDRVSLPRGASDAALAPYHVDRSKMFVRERLGQRKLFDLDPDRIAAAIEFTRFPVASTETTDNQPLEGLLVRAADLVGQLGDPNYLRKANALYWEFYETGIAAHLGYHSPADVIESYPEFFWRAAHPHIRIAERYLEVTDSGRGWLAHLESNVSRAGRASWHGPTVPEGKTGTADLRDSAPPR
ncbi:MAG: metal-dependent phosphohydrolase [Hyphomicrobiales bacterium]